MYKLLIIEDDRKLRDLLKELLEKYGYSVSTIMDFKNVESQFDQTQPDLVLLDINLPYSDGYYLCRSIRRRSHVPIVVISARSDDMEQVLGIESGADDYIVKPLNMEILLSRIKAVLRRYSGEYSGKERAELNINGFALDEGTFRISWKGRYSELSKKEYKLIRKLAEKKNRIVTREELLDELWDDSTFVDDNTLTVNVTRIKGKLAELGLNEVVKTKRGAGYIFDSTALKERSQNP